MALVRFFQFVNVRRARTAILALALGACSNITPDAQRDLTLMPREVRLGAADMVIARVEPTVAREEVAATVQGMLTAAPICLSWPGVWLEAPTVRRTAYVVRYDLMRRDWGAEVAEAARQRMEEFVALGFMTREDLSERGGDIVQYSLTYQGREHLQGSPYGGDRPTFCGPAERRLVEITALEFGNYPCGSLRVSFTHTADDWPSWARAERTRSRLAESWPQPGVQSSGTVTLSRQWYRENQVPAGVRNGALKSVCYDASRQRVIGDDLDLAAALPAAE
ncbi:hypothetical protein [Terricaulis sp.]|uniref:hypothetical protein n=1 Tax=Terricaulis sp. TaxID=2768686 RepID=UPI003784BD09